MKKFNLLFALLCFVSINTMAGSDIKVKNGKISILKEDVQAHISFDFSNAKWEEKEDFKDYSGDQYEKRINTAQTNFVNTFNYNSKNLMIVGSDKDADYEIRFKIDNLERHQSFSGMFGQGKISVTGTVDIIEKKTQESVCTLFIYKYGSGKDFDTTDGIGKCFMGFGKEFSKLK